MAEFVKFSTTNKILSKMVSGWGIKPMSMWLKENDIKFHLDRRQQGFFTVEDYYVNKEDFNYLILVFGEESFMRLGLINSETMLQ
jgi:hypothetical protein